MPNKTITLSCFDIVVTLTGEGGTITSSLREEDSEGNELFNVAMDGIEALILAHACAGVDITTPAYLEGIETAVEAACAKF